MQLLREPFETAEGIRAIAALELSENRLILRLKSKYGQELYDLGDEVLADQMTSGILDLTMAANEMTWNELQYAAERMLSNDFWNKNKEGIK